MFLLSLFMLSGCDAINKVKDTVDGLLNPVVTQGVVLGVQPPDSPELQGVLAGTDFSSGTTATVFMADATEVQEIENAPIAGAIVTLTGPGVAAAIDEVDAGTYTLTPGADPVVYTAGDAWTITVDRAGSDGNTVRSTVVLQLPQEADFSTQLPEMHELDTAITLDFSGLGFDSALIVVLDENGDVTFSNEPGSIKELYEFTRGNASLTTLEIPGTAFATEAVFAVGVAGMKNTDAGDFVEMNTALSSVIYGKMNFYPVSTRPVPPVP